MPALWVPVATFSGAVAWRLDDDNLVNYRFFEIQIAIVDSGLVGLMSLITKKMYRCGKRLLFNSGLTMLFNLFVS